jgi:SAM-dependent MidA family methyltransferase
MTPLETMLRRRIKLTGPISVAEYMAQCLFHPEHGYYTTREPFGAQGDFTTSPEISQMFGEIIAAWWLASRDAIGMPSMQLGEIGPGRGTLMDDMLRTIGKLARALPPVHMIEASPRLAATQQALLSRHTAEVTWHPGISSLPTMPLGIIANELFDALPIRQFEKTSAGWLERMIHIDDEDALSFILSHNELDAALLPARRQTAPIGSLFEFAPARLAMLQTIAGHLISHGGFALLIDYGHARSGLGDTLQAVRAHQYVSIFDQPGESDITSHVDFEGLAKAARASRLFTTQIMSQGQFLISAGIDQRAAQLAAIAGAGTAQSIKAALDRLTSKDKMGQLFKVLAVSSRPFDAHPLKFGH